MKNLNIEDNLLSISMRINIKEKISLITMKTNFNKFAEQAFVNKNCSQESGKN